jgi:hypothetical protein
MVVGGLFLAAGVATMRSLSHPNWSGIVGVAIFLPAADLGASLAGPGTPRIEPAVVAD